MKRAPRLARRIFRPLLYTDGPASLDLEGVDRDQAIAAVREVGDMVRCTDATDPLDALYVFTAGSRAAFVPTRLDRIWLRVRMAFFWLRPFN